MTSSGFDPQFIGRESEQELFEKLLSFETAARILAFKAKGGDGKSLLLKKCQQRCRTGNPRIPFSFTALDQQDYSSPLLLIKDIASQLNSVGITFDNFERNERARLVRSSSGITSLTNLQRAGFSGAEGTQIGGIINNEGTVNVSGATEPLRPEQDKAAQDDSIKFFFDDLHEYCSAKPIVIMLDSFEKCNNVLEHWLVNHFLERNFFSAACESCLLVLVIAGKTIPDFYSLGPQEFCDSKIILLNELGKWTKDNVAECLRAHGNVNYPSHELDAIHGLIEKGHSLLTVVETIALFSKDPRGQQ